MQVYGVGFILKENLKSETCLLAKIDGLEQINSFFNGKRLNNTLFFDILMKRITGIV